jgi:hypothetical protein
MYLQGRESHETHAVYVSVSESHEFSCHVSERRKVMNPMAST